MAEENRKVRIEERLKIKIGEAKNLQCRSHGSTSHRDVYCTVSLDQEEIFRTTTMEKTLNPFFGEEFQFEVPRRFRYLSVYVYDRDRHLKQDKVIGKVAIKREDLGQYHNKDYWFPIRHVDADSEVQGKVNIEIKYESNKNDTSGHIKVRIIECIDLTLKNGNCDPYATIDVIYTNGKKHSKRTKVKKKTTCPQFDDAFSFETSECTKSDSSSGWIIPGEWDAYEICVTLYHDSGMGADDLFLGEVRIPLSGNSKQISSPNAWYFLQPRKGRERNGSTLKGSCSTPPGTRLSCDNSLGSLRLQVHYIADHVFPSEYYNQLRHLLLQSIHVKPITSSAVYILGEIVASKADAAQPLVRVFMHHGQIVPIIGALADLEISKLTDPTTIFRGNTLVSKMMDESMRLAGLHYLHCTLRPALDLVIRERRPCEVDPTRVSDPTTIATNRTNLLGYVDSVFDAIVRSAVNCPPLLCQIFNCLKESAIVHFPENREVRYSVISGFIFLRFFAPAILGPRLFDLTTEQIDSQTNRTLTLISKTIQSLGNLVSARSAQQSFKEEYMEGVHRAFATDTHMHALRQFLDIISASTSPERGSFDMPVLLKEGVMTKRAQGRKRFGRKNFKQRYFRLTTHDLTYSKTKGKDPLCRIPLADILAVERLNEDSFKMKNMFQVVQRERALYVQAGNCVEQKEWVDLLTKLCLGNGDRLQRYHPSAYLNGHWQCCHSSNELAAGCSETSSHETNLHTSLDPDRDLERVHSLLVAHVVQLEATALVCERRLSAHHSGIYEWSHVIQEGARGSSGVELRGVVAGHSINGSQHSSVTSQQDWTEAGVRDTAVTQEEATACLKTIQQLRAATYNLEQQHRTYLRTVARETKYGSKQAPIGDDNYLHVASRLIQH